VQQPNRIRLPARRVWERLGIVDRTLNRWLVDPRLNFPRPIYVNRRRYFWFDEIEAWERNQLNARRPIGDEAAA
jgi:predicted DNA-binding transcriptional regulator AlpA